MAIAYEGLRAAVKARCEELAAGRLANAMAKVQSAWRGHVGRRQYKMLLQERTLQRQYLREYENLIGQVQLENARRARARELAEELRSENFRSRIIVQLQAAHRGLMARKRLAQRLEAREEQRGLAVEFSGMMSAVRRAIDAKLEADAIEQERAAAAEQVESGPSPTMAAVCGPSSASEAQSEGQHGWRVPSFQAMRLFPTRRLSSSGLSARRRRRTRYYLTRLPRRLTHSASALASCSGRSCSFGRPRASRQTVGASAPSARLSHHPSCRSSSPRQSCTTRSMRPRSPCRAASASLCPLHSHCQLTPCRPLAAALLSCRTRRQARRPRRTTRWLSWSGWVSRRTSAM